MKMFGSVFSSKEAIGDFCENSYSQVVELRAKVEQVEE